MYGKTSDAHHFMGRTGSHSTKGSRRGFVDVDTGVNPNSLLTPAQRRDSLKRQYEALGRRREELKKNRSDKTEWMRLGRDMQDVQNEMAELNRAITPDRSAYTFDRWFRECAKTMLSTVDFGRIAEAARRRELEAKQEPTP